MKTQIRQRLFHARWFRQLTVVASVLGFWACLWEALTHWKIDYDVRTTWVKTSADG